jgi:putative flippase GtrA
MLKFSVVGLINTAIDVTLFALLIHVLNWDVLPANILSYSAGILNSFLMNKCWTFQDQKPLSRSLKPFTNFVLINVSSLFLSSGAVWIFAQYLPEMLAKLGSVGLVFVWNYSMTRLLVFSPPTR